MKHCNINSQTASRQEILAEINRLIFLMNLKKNEEQAIKIFINSTYGATASPYFVGYNVKVAEAITLQGQEVRGFASKAFNRYFNEFWHKDKQLHELMGITVHSPVKDEVAIYGDTDTISSDSVLYTNTGKKTIEEIYIENLKNSSFVEISPNGHEVICPKNLRVQNFIDNQIIQVNVKHLIRHKSTKKRWVLKTKSGKKIAVTEDHSLVVFRDGNKLKVKPAEVLKTDKILVKCEKPCASQ